MKILSKFEMDELTTPRLLAYRNSLLRCREEHHWDAFPDATDETLTKNDDAWKRCRDQCLDILKNREHVKKKRKRKTNN